MTGNKQALLVLTQRLRCEHLFYSATFFPQTI